MLVSETAAATAGRDTGNLFPAFSPEHCLFFYYLDRNAIPYKPTLGQILVEKALA